MALEVVAARASLKRLGLSQRCATEGEQVAVTTAAVADTERPDVSDAQVSHRIGPPGRSSRLGTASVVTAPTAKPLQA